MRKKLLLLLLLCGSGWGVAADKKASESLVDLAGEVESLETISDLLQGESSLLDMTFNQCVKLDYSTESIKPESLRTLEASRQNLCIEQIKGKFAVLASKVKAVKSYPDFGLILSSINSLEPTCGVVA